MNWIRADMAFGLKAKIFRISKHLYTGKIINPEHIESFFLDVAKFAVNIPEDVMVYQISFPYNENSIMVCCIHKDFKEVKDGAIIPIENIIIKKEYQHERN